MQCSDIIHKMCGRTPHTHCRTCTVFCHMSICASAWCWDRLASPTCSLLLMQQLTLVHRCPTLHCPLDRWGGLHTKMDRHMSLQLRTLAATEAVTVVVEGLEARVVGALGRLETRMVEELGGMREVRPLLSSCANSGSLLRFNWLWHRLKVTHWVLFSSQCTHATTSALQYLANLCYGCT